MGVILAALLALWTGVVYAQDIGPPCDAATALTCPLTDPTIVGRLARYGDTSGNIDGICTATCSGGTITGALTGNASTATALAADPADCSPGNLANAIAASAALTCSADYLQLSGRATGQVAIGGTASGDDLTFRSTDHATKGDLIFDDAQQWWPSVPDSSGSQSIARFNATIALSGASPNLTTLSLIPTVTSSATIAPVLSAVEFGANYTTTATPVLYLFNIFNATATTQSATNGVPPLLPDTFRSGPIIQQTANTATSPFATVSFLATTQHKANGGNLDLTGTFQGLQAGEYGFFFWPSLVSLAGNTMAMDRMAALFARTPVTTGCAGTCNVDNYYGSYIEPVGSVATTTYGHFVAAQTSTNSYPYAAGEQTVSTTPPAGTGVWGIESGAPNRFFFKDESGNVRYFAFVHATDCTTLSGLDNGALCLEADSNRIFVCEEADGDCTGDWVEYGGGAAAGDVTAVGDCTTGACFVDGTNAGTVLVYEGATVDGNENRLAFTGDPGADTVVTIPNETGTICTTASVCTGYGDITDVWTDTGGGVDALVAAAGDSFSAASADSSIPAKAATGAAGTNDCSGETAEGRACHDTDDNLDYVGDGSAARLVSAQALVTAPPIGSIATAATEYWAITGASANAGTTEGNFDLAVPAMHLHRMRCCLTVPPDNGAGVDSYTLTVREAGAGTATTCTIADANTCCTWSGTEAIADGALVAMESVPANAPAASDPTCVILYTMDVF